MKKLIGLLLFVLLAWPVASRAASTRATPEHIGLRLNRVNVSELRSATVSGNDLTIQLYAARLRSKPLARWVSEGLTGKRLEQGALVFMDANYKQQRRLEFQNAIIREIDLPALDAAGKSAAIVTLKVHAQSTRSGAADSKVWRVSPGTIALQNNFKMLVSGVDTAYVTKIQFSNLTPGTPSTYRMSVVVPTAHAQSFQNWYKSKQKKSGQVVLRASGGSAVFAVMLRGLFVSRMSWSSTSATVDTFNLTFDGVALK